MDMASLVERAHKALDEYVLVVNDDVCQRLAEHVIACRKVMGPRPVTYRALVDETTNGAYLPWVYVQKTTRRVR